jgi:hypothetical protein
MKKIVTITLALFFIALSANAFASDIIGEFTNALGSAQKIVYDNLWTRPYQAGISTRQALDLHINNFNNIQAQITSSLRLNLNIAYTLPDKLYSASYNSLNYLRDTISATTKLNMDSLRGLSSQLAYDKYNMLSSASKIANLNFNYARTAGSEYGKTIKPHIYNFYNSGVGTNKPKFN